MVAEEIPDVPRTVRGNIERRVADVLNGMSAISVLGVIPFLIRFTERIGMTTAEMESKVDKARHLFRDDALEVFCANPLWQRRYTSAPDGAKAYYAALFADALHALVGVDDDEWKRVTNAMGVEDWQYMAETTGNQMAKAHYRKIVSMIEESGCPVTAAGPEVLNPFVNLEKED